MKVNFTKMNYSFVFIKNRLLHFIYVFFPVLTIITFLAIFFDIYKYLGFFKKHFFIDTISLFNFLLLAGLIISVFPLKKTIPLIDNLEKIFYKFNIFFLPLLIILYIYFNDLLTKKGLNYIFSKYHIQPQNMPLLIFFSAFILFIYLFKQIPDKTI